MTGRRLYYTFAKLFPKSYRKRMAQYLVFANDKSHVDQWLGSGALLGLCVVIIFILFPIIIFEKFSPLWAFFGIMSYLLVQFFVYLVLYFKADDRRNRIESVLPDQLQLVASNLNAGMTPFQALKTSAREEFGPLTEEINQVLGRSMGVEDFNDVLKSISKRVHSAVVERAFSLMGSALQSGGKLADLMTDVAKDIVETRKLKQELVTATKTYTAFMVFTIMFGTPLLLAISIHFLTIVTGLQASTGVTNIGGDLGGLVGEVSITVGFLTKASVVILVLTATLASILIGVIKDGKLQDGFKMAPMMVAGVLLMFFFFRYVISTFLGNVF